MNLVESSKSEKDQRIKELRLTSSGTKLANELTKVQNKKMNAIFKNLLDNYLLISYHINNNNYYYYKMVTKSNYLYMDTIV